MNSVCSTSLFVFLMTMILSLGCNSSQHTENVDSYLNRCLKGMHHKDKPGPESELFAQCEPWKSHSCCSANTSNNIHTESNYLNFNWDHCKDLSLRCRQYFTQDMCFYECSPNVGPWLVEDVRKIRKERYRDVPLCQSDCFQWWDACKDEFTCVENWAEQFNWTSGINKCPTGSECRPFHEVYSGPQHFCENLFGPSFKVVPDSPGDCFYLWFDSKHPNPNREVALKKINAILGTNSGVHVKPYGVALIFLSFFLFYVCFNILS